MLTRSALLFIVSQLSACQASANAHMQAKSNGSLEADAHADAKSESRSDSEGALSPATAPLGPAGYAGVEAYSETGNANSEAMLGARAGLRMPKPATAVCQCLGVQVGNPNDPGFAWEGPVPKTNPSTQLVIGLSSEGLPCPNAPTDSLGASYRGYEIIGLDVVVEVETARLGRPITQGAVLPKPASGGRIQIRSSDNRSPYGRSLDGRSPNCYVWPKS